MRFLSATRLLATGAVVALAVGIVACGSTTTTTTSTTSAAGSGTVTVAVTSPTSGTVIAADSVTVRGTVDPPTATVEVQGKPAPVGNGVFLATANLHGGKTTIDVIGSAPGRAPGSTSVSVTKQSSGGSGGSKGQPGGGGTPGIAKALPGSGAGAQGPPSNTSSCGGELSVGPNTSCAFAAQVRGAYQRNGAGTVEVYSPVTQKTYFMTCGGTPVVCTGGNNASVYFP
jgi:glucodextranase-like protein